MNTFKGASKPFLDNLSLNVTNPSYEPVFQARGAKMIPAY